MPSISRITDATLEEVKRSRGRSLESRYVAIFLDALFFYLRRETAEKEPIFFAMGTRETGEYEIMGFYLASKEFHNSYVEVIKDLHERGVREPLLLITDGLPN
jgi:transposase-like protein